MGQKLLHTGLRHFEGTWAIFRRSRFKPKMNITFSITNLMLNIFILNNFFVKSVFSEEDTKKTVLGEPKCNNSSPTLYNSILRDFHVLHCISSIYHIIMPFFEKYIRIKIENHKILVLMSKLSPKSDEINTSYPCKYIIQSCVIFVYFIVFRQFTT